MSQDRRLVDTIKEHFARKSSAQLQEILQTNDRERWSEEAFAAAREILADRAAGRAQEPLVVEEDPLPPATGHTEGSLAFMAGLNLLTLPLGFVVLPINRHREEDTDALDQPVPFGYETAWLALNTTDTLAAAGALGLQEARHATWAEGIDEAYKSSVFVTPPLGDWTLAVGAVLSPPDRADAFVKPLLERLSLQFGDAQYFCTQRVREMQIWAFAQQGKLVRGYGCLGEQVDTLWNEGTPTPQERHLGFQFVEEPSQRAKQDNDERAFPDENCVMQLAFLWSIDPTSLNEQHKEPVPGVLGSIAWNSSRASL